MVRVGLGGSVNGVPREDGFVITAASEIMAVLCLASSLGDLKRRLGNIVIGYGEDGEEIRARDLRAEESMTVLLRDALRPNLVQTLEGTPAFVHGGPFANIAHGCNSVIAIDDIFGNIVNYAYTPEVGKVTVRLAVDEKTLTASLTFIDSGVPYNPLEKDDPDTTLSAEDRKIGGLGIFLVKKSMDDMRYEYKDGKNILTLVKKLA